MQPGRRRQPLPRRRHQPTGRASNRWLTQLAQRGSSDGGRAEGAASQGLRRLRLPAERAWVLPAQPASTNNGGFRDCPLAAGAANRSVRRWCCCWRWQRPLSDRMRLVHPLAAAGGAGDRARLSPGSVPCLVGAERLLHQASTVAVGRRGSKDLLARHRCT